MPKLPELARCRATVKWFARYMELVLRQHDARGDIEKNRYQFLLSRAHQEMAELTKAVDDMESTIPRFGHDEVIKEAVDVTNFCMALAARASRDKVRKEESP